MAEVTPPSLPAARRRPLSPHLQIYRPMLTMMMSIAHRITGAALYVGTLLLAWWLLAIATDAKAYAQVNFVLTSLVGRVVLFGFTWALFHHLMGGIRHFIWDTGKGMEHPAREYLALATLIGGLVLNVIVWAIVYAVR